MAASYCMGTIKGVEDDKFDAEDAADRLRKAMKGLGTDELQIIKVLTEHNNAQRQTIKEKYKAVYGRDLEKDLKSELAGNFEDLCLYLLMPAQVFDAVCLHKSIKGLGTKEVRLIDILVTRSNMEMDAIKQAYKAQYERELEEDVTCDTSGDFKRVLVALLQGMRKEDQNVDEDAAKADMRELYNGGEGLRLGTDEDAFTKVMVNRSVPHLQKVFELYKGYAEKDIEDSIKSEFSGDAQTAFLAIAQYIRDPLKYFANCLFETMKGLGTDDHRLMQLIVSHTELDLEDISKVYEEQQKTSLYQHVHDDMKGDYRKLLLRLVKPSGDEKKENEQ